MAEAPVPGDPGTLAGVESPGEQRKVTRLGLWLTGPWPVPPADGGIPDPSVPIGSGPVVSSVLDHVAALAEMAEQVGFDSVWVTDRVPADSSDHAGHPGPEAYSLLGALAARTRVVRLGAVPLGEDRRPPSMVGKIVTGIDVISHGRALLTYGLGAADGVRGARTIEALRVGRALLEDETPTFEGTFYRVVEAMNRPGPVQPGGVPVVVFFEHQADVASVAVTEFAGLADAVIVDGTAGDLRRLVEVVRSAPAPGGSGPGGGVGPLQVIGIGLLPGMTGPGPAGATEHAIGVPRASSLVQDLFDAGVDGCLVPLDLSTPVGSLAALAAGSGAF
jgi:alkanesulfonate monooxygenase SsuD/methylene tetrahydromethanopterin reductase-like flavin-dependent oxidoreductase (luciferase family)